MFVFYYLNVWNLVSSLLGSPYNLYHVAALDTTFIYKNPGLA